MPKPDPNMQWLSFYLPVETKEKFRRLVGSEGKSMSAVLLQLVEEYLRRKERVRG